jgi:hypothetical protein
MNPDIKSKISSCSSEIRILATEIEHVKSSVQLAALVGETASRLIQLNTLLLEWQSHENKVYESKIHEGGAL